MRFSKPVVIVDVHVLDSRAELMNHSWNWNVGGVAVAHV
jgi:hypothetical protein